MPDAPLKILVLCTGNSARSILGECLINAIDSDRFIAVSAGSDPAGRVNPFALELLAGEGFATEALRSKSWDEFSDSAVNGDGIDIVITVCDSAAAESCPVWPGHPLTTHWGIPDPAAVTECDELAREAFRLAWRRMQRRVTALAALDTAALTRIQLKDELDNIGRWLAEDEAST